jgi:hypothetical protein
MTVGGLLSPLAGHATEGALGRPVAGTSVTPNIGVIPDQPVWIANVQQLYMDGSIGGGREVPMGGRTTAGIDAKIAFTLATVMKVWDTGPGAWNFASSFTLPYVWTTVHTSAVFTGPGGIRSRAAPRIARRIFTISISARSSPAITSRRPAIWR